MSRKREREGEDNYRNYLNSNKKEKTFIKMQTHITNRREYQQIFPVGDQGV